MFLSDRGSYDVHGVALIGQTCTTVSHNFLATPQSRSYYHHFPFICEESEPRKYIEVIIKMMMISSIY